MSLFSIDSRLKKKIYQNTLKRNNEIKETHVCLSFPCKDNFKFIILINKKKKDQGCFSHFTKPIAH